VIQGTGSEESLSWTTLQHVCVSAEMQVYVCELILLLFELLSRENRVRARDPHLNVAVSS
jgi:hypothetical protein